MSCPHIEDPEGKTVDLKSKHKLACSVFPAQFTDYFNMSCPTQEQVIKNSDLQHRHDLSCSTLPVQFQHQYGLSCSHRTAASSNDRPISTTESIANNLVEKNKNLRFKHDLTCSNIPSQFETQKEVSCEATKQTIAQNADLKSKHELACSTMPLQFQSKNDVTCTNNLVTTASIANDPVNKNQHLRYKHDLTCSNMPSQFETAKNVSCNADTIEQFSNQPDLREAQETYFFTKNFEEITTTQFFKSYIMSLMPTTACMKNKRCTQCVFHVFNDKFEAFKIDKSGYSATRCSMLMEYVHSNTHVLVALNETTGNIVYPHTIIQTNITKYTMLVVLLVVVMTYSLNVL